MENKTQSNNQEKRRIAMNRKYNNVGLTVLMGFICFIILAPQAFALMWVNNLPIVYQQNPGLYKSQSIDDSIVNGAVYFLNSYSDYILLMNKIELSSKQGIDYSAVGSITNRVITNLEMMKATYSLIIRKSSITAYNTDMLKRLEVFDYQGFLDKAALNPLIFNDVRAYLIKGDIPGIYSRILNDTEQILAGLYGIKKQIDSGIFPDINNLWSLNQAYSNLMFFGQYVSMVCGQIAI
jgi:hypothetical protein